MNDIWIGVIFTIVGIIIAVVVYAVDRRFQKLEEKTAEPETNSKEYGPRDQDEFETFSTLREDIDQLLRSVKQIEQRRAVTYSSGHAASVKAAEIDARFDALDCCINETNDRLDSLSEYLDMISERVTNLEHDIRMMRTEGADRDEGDPV